MEITKKHILGGILIGLILEAAFSYVFVAGFVTERRAQYLAEEAEAKEAVERNLSFLNVNPLSGGPGGARNRYTIQVRFEDPAVKAKVEENADRIVHAVELILRGRRIERLEDQELERLKRRVTAQINRYIAPAHVADISIEPRR